MQTESAQSIETRLDRPGLYAIGSRPGIGKTATALALTDRCLENGRSVLYFSLETARAALLERFEKVHGPKDISRFHIVDDPAYDHVKIPETIRRMAEKDPLMHCVFIDYCELVGTSGEREKDLEQMLQALRELAKTLALSIAVLGQMKPARTETEVPEPDDLVCQGLKQSADALFLLYLEKGEVKLQAM